MDVGSLWKRCLVVSVVASFTLGAQATEREAAISLALRKIEVQVGLVKSMNGLRLPPGRSYSLDTQIKEFRAQFPEYADMLDEYVVKALPWYPLPPREGH